MLDINPKYHQILEREFRRVLTIPSNVPIHTIWGVEEEGESSNEMIYLIVSPMTSTTGPRLYAMFIGSDDDGFFFVNQETGDSVSFDFPDDWIELEEGGEDWGSER